MPISHAAKVPAGLAHVNPCTRWKVTGNPLCLACNLMDCLAHLFTAPVVLAAGASAHRIFRRSQGCDENLRKEKFSEAASCLASGTPPKWSFGHIECAHDG